MLNDTLKYLSAAVIFCLILPAFIYAAVEINQVSIDESLHYQVDDSVEVENVTVEVTGDLSIKAEGVKFKSNFKVKKGGVFKASPIGDLEPLPLPETGSEGLLSGPVITSALSPQYTAIFTQSGSVDIRFRWDSGSWIEVSVNAASYVIQPASDLSIGYHTLELQEWVVDSWVTTGFYNFYIGVAPDLPVFTHSVIQQSSFPTWSWTGDVNAYEWQMAGDSSWTTTQALSHVSPLALGDGQHTFRLRAIDGLGVKSDIIESTIVVDTADPVIALTSPQNKSYFESGAFNLQFSVSDLGVGVDTASIEVRLNGGLLTIPSSETTFDLNLNSLPPGLHLVQVGVQDQLGRGTQTEWWFYGVTNEDTQNVGSDTNPPNMTWMSPAYDGYVFDAAEQSIELTFNDDATVVNLAQIELELDGQVIWPTTADWQTDSLPDLLEEMSQRGLRIEANKLVYTWPNSFNETLAQGQHQVRVKLIDLAGQSNEVFRDFWVSDQVPTITFSVLPNTTFTQNPVDIQATVSNLVGDVLTYSIDSKLNGLSIPSSFNGDILRFDQAQILSEGLHNLVVDLTDAEGRRIQGNLEFAVDTEGPVFNFTHNLNANDVLPQGQLDIGFNITDLSGIDLPRLSWSIEGESLPIRNKGQNESFSLQLPDGSYRIELSARDIHGNESFLEKLFLVDSSGPELIETIDGQAYQDKAKLWSFQIEDPHLDLLAHPVSATINDDPLSLAEVGGAWTFVLPESLAEGIHEIQVSVQDTLGHATLESWQVTYIPAQGPLVSWGSPLHPHNVLTSEPSYWSLQIENEYAFINLEQSKIFINGVEQAIVPTLDGAELKWNHPVGMEDQSLLIKMLAVNPFGQTSQLEQTWYLDRVAPSITLQTPQDEQYYSEVPDRLELIVVESVSGVDPVTSQIRLNGENLSVSLEDNLVVSDLPSFLSEGQHTIEWTIFDYAGFSDTGSMQFWLDNQAPRWEELIGVAVGESAASFTWEEQGSSIQEVSVQVTLPGSLFTNNQELVDDIANIALEAHDASGQIGTYQAQKVITLKQRPSATDDQFTMNKGEVLVMSDLLSNDSDPDQQVLTINSVSAPVNGSVISLGGSLYQYTPNPSFSGTEVLTYTIQDDHGLSSSAQINITVNHVDTPPRWVVAQNFQVNEGASLSLSGVVTAIDEDQPSESLNVVVTALPNFGDLILNSQTLVVNDSFALSQLSQLQYEHLGAENLGDQFSWKLKDNTDLESEVLSMSVIVNPVDDAPSLSLAQAIVLNEDEAKSFQINLSDVDNTPSDYTWSIQSTHSIFENSGINLIPSSTGATLALHPMINLSGSETLSVRISKGGSDWDQDFPITVNAVNDVPQIQGEQITLDLAAPRNVIVFPQMSDVENSHLTLSLSTAPANGSVSIVGNKVTYSRELTSNYYGNDSFGLQANDGSANSQEALFQVTTIWTNLAPSVTALADFSLSDLGAASLTAVVNDDGVPSNPLSYEWVKVSGPEVEIETPTSLESNVNFTLPGAYVFRIYVRDGEFTANDEVQVTVTVPTGTPKFFNDAYIFNTISSLDLNIFSNDVDVQSLDLSLVGFSTPSHGTLVWIDDLNRSLGLRYTPDPDMTSDSFIYQTDVGENGISATVTLSYDAHPTLPSLSAQSFYYEGELEKSLVLFDSADPAYSNVEIKFQNAPSKGQVYVSATGVITYAFDDLLTQQDSFKVYLQKGALIGNPVEMTVIQNQIEIHPPSWSWIKEVGDSNQVLNQEIVVQFDLSPYALDPASLSIEVNAQAHTQFQLVDQILKIDISSLEAGSHQITIDVDNIHGHSSDENQTIDFEVPVKYEISSLIMPANSGTIEGLDASGTESFTEGSILEVKAKPSQGYIFSHWEHVLKDSNPEWSTIVEEDLELKAVFMRAPEELVKASLIPADIKMHEATGCIVYFQGRVPTNGEAPLDLANNFMEKYRLELCIHPSVLLKYSIFRQLPGMTVVLATQNLGDVEMVGADIVMIFNAQNELTLYQAQPSQMNPGALSIGLLNLNPSLNTLEVNDLLNAQVGPEEILNHELVIFNPARWNIPNIDSGDHLAYLVDYQEEDRPGISSVYINANTGKFLFTYHQVPGINQHEISTAANGYQYPGTILKDVLGESADYLTHPLASTVFDWLSQIKSEMNLLFSEPYLTMEETTPVHITLDFGPPENPPVAFVDRNYLVFSPEFVSLDLLAHEYGHLWVDEKFAPKYFYESGSLAEAFADLYAVFITASIGNQALDSKAWTIGEELPASLIPHGYIRELSNPSLNYLPDHLSRYQFTEYDNGGIHINSHIITKLFYLLVHGGTHYQIDVPKIDDISKVRLIFLEVANCLTPNANFANLSEVMMSVTQMNFGEESDELTSVEAVLAATGLTQELLEGVVYTPEGGLEVTGIKDIDLNLTVPSSVLIADETIAAGETREGQASYSVHVVRTNVEATAKLNLQAGKRVSLGNGVRISGDLKTGHSSSVRENTAPEITMAGTTSLPFPSSYQFKPTVEDDGFPLGFELKYLWSVASKPENAQIRNLEADILEPSIVVTQPGTYEFVLKVSDGSRISSATQTLRFDGQGPEIESDIDEELVWHTEDPVVTFTITDDFTGFLPDSVQLLVNDTVRPTSEWDLVGSTLVWSPVIEDGKHEFVLSVTDAVGNRSQFSEKLWIDRNHPSIISNFSQDTYVKERPTVEFELSDSISGFPWSKVSLKVDGESIETTPINNKITYQAPVSWTEATHTFEFYTEDYAGNSKDLSFSLIYDTTPPSVQQLEPLPEVSMTSSTVAFLINFADSNSGLNHNTFRWEKNGNPRKPSPYDEGLFSTTLYNQSSRTHRVSFYIEDLAGNPVIHEIPFTVDVTPPSEVLPPVSFSLPLISQMTIDAASGLLTQPPAEYVGNLRAELFSVPQFGSASVSSDGSFIYTHSLSRDVQDSFTYRLFDDENNAFLGTVNIDQYYINSQIVTSDPNPNPRSVATFQVVGDNLKAYQVKLDDGPFGPITPIAQVIELTSLSEGEHTITVIGQHNNDMWEPIESASSYTWTQKYQPELIFSHESGDYSEPFELTISSPDDPNATIYYSIDGSNTREGGLVTYYHQTPVSIMVTKDTSLKAYVKDLAETESDSESRVFTFASEETHFNPSLTWVDPLSIYEDITLPNQVIRFDVSHEPVTTMSLVSFHWNGQDVTASVQLIDSTYEFTPPSSFQGDLQLFKIRLQDDLDPGFRQSDIHAVLHSNLDSLSTTVSHETGLYKGTIRVRLDSNHPADIHYTLDGTDPLSSPSVITKASPVLNLEISSDTELRFYSENESGDTDTPQTVHYTFDNDLPIINLTSHDLALPINDAKPIFVFEVTDPSSSIDSDSLRVEVNQKDYSDEITISETNPSEFSFTFFENLIEGLHVLNVSVLDEAGNRQSFNGNFRVDLTAPTFTSSRPSSRFNQAFDLSFTASESVSFYYTTDLSDPMPGQAMTMVWNTGDAPLNVTESITYKVVAVDLVGLQSLVHRFDYVYEGTAGAAPVLSMVQFKDREVILTWDPASVSSAETLYIYRSVNQEQSMRIASLDMSAYQGSSYTDLNPSLGYTSNYWISQVDSSTIESLYSLSFSGISQNEAPQIIDLLPEDGSIFNTADVSFSGKAMDASAVSSVHLGQDLVNTSNSFEDWTLTKILSEGENQISITAKDEYGHQSSKEITIKIDTQVPIITSNLATGKYAEVQELSLTTDQESTIYYTTHSTDDPIATGSSALGELNVTIDDQLELRYQAVDLAGNESLIETINIQVIEEQPSITDLAPADQHQFTNENRPVISFNFTTYGADINASNSYVKLNNQLLAGAWDTSSFTYTPVSDLNDDDYSLEIYLENEVGVSITQKTTFSIDTSAPSISWFVMDGGVESPLSGGQIVDGVLTYTSSTSKEIFYRLTRPGKLIYTLDVQLPIKEALNSFELQPEQILSLSETVTLTSVVLGDSGLFSEAEVQSFVIDTTVPTIAVAKTLLSTWDDLELSIGDSESGIDWNQSSVLINSSTTYNFIESADPIADFKTYLSLTEGQHSFDFTVKNKLGLTKNSLINLDLDETLPVTSATPVGGAYNMDELTGYPDGLEVSLSVTESNPQSTYYTLDGSEPNPSSSATYLYSGASIRIVSPTTIKFKSFDAAGNEEAVVTQAYNYTYDSSAPIASVQWPNLGQVVSPAINPQLSIQMQDPETGIDSGATQITIDGQNMILDNTVGDIYSYTYPSLADGQYPFVLSIVNQAGQKTVIEDTIIIDTTEATITVAPPAGTYHLHPGDPDFYKPNGIDLSFSSNEPNSSIYFNFDSATDPVPGENGTYLFTGEPVYIYESRSIRYIGYDQAGNPSPAQSASYTYELDTTSPIIESVTPEINSVSPTAISQVSIKINTRGETLDQATSRILINEENKAFTWDSVTGTLSVSLAPALADGTYLIDLLIFTVEGSSQSFFSTFSVDTLAPITSVDPAEGTYSNRKSAGEKYRPQGIHLRFNVEDDSLAKTYYTIDGSNPIEDPAYLYDNIPVTLTDSSTTVKFFSVDEHGHSESIQEVTYLFDGNDSIGPLVESFSLENFSVLQSLSDITLQLISVENGSAQPLDLAQSYLKIGSEHWNVDDSLAAQGTYVFSPPSALTENTYALDIYLVDEDGANDEVTFSFDIDQSITDTSILPAPGTYSHDPAMGVFYRERYIEVTLGNSDPNLELIYYTIDGSSPDPASETTFVYNNQPIYVRESTTFNYYAIDKAGNQEIEKSATYNFTVDQTPPMIVACSIVNGEAFEILPSDLTLTLVDPESGIDVVNTSIFIGATQLNISGENDDDYSWSLPTDLSFGTHTVSMEICNNAGVKLNKSFDFTYEDAGTPVVSIFPNPAQTYYVTQTGDDSYYPDGIPVQFVTNKPGVTIYYSLQNIAGGEWPDPEPGVPGTFEYSGTPIVLFENPSLKYKAVDSLGNETGVVTVHYNYNTNPQSPEFSNVTLPTGAITSSSAFNLSITISPTESTSLDSYGLYVNNQLQTPSSVIGEVATSIQLTYNTDLLTGLSYGKNQLVYVAESSEKVVSNYYAELDYTDSLVTTTAVYDLDYLSQLSEQAYPNGIPVTLNVNKANSVTYYAFTTAAENKDPALSDPDTKIYDGQAIYVQDDGQSHFTKLRFFSIDEHGVAESQINEVSFDFSGDYAPQSSLKTNVTLSEGVANIEWTLPENSNIEQVNLYRFELSKGWPEKEIFDFFMSWTGERDQAKLRSNRPSSSKFTNQLLATLPVQISSYLDDNLSLEKEYIYVVQSIYKTGHAGSVDSSNWSYAHLDFNHSESNSSHPSPNVEFPIEVTLSTVKSGATLYYTLDGSDPDEYSNEFNINTPIQITGATQLKYRSYYRGIWEPIHSIHYKEDDVLPELNELSILSSRYVTSSISFVIEGKVSDSGSGIDFLRSNLRINNIEIDNPWDGDSLYYTRDWANGDYIVDINLYDQYGNYQNFRNTLVIDDADPIITRSLEPDVYNKSQELVINITDTTETTFYYSLEATPSVDYTTWQQTTESEIVFNLNDTTSLSYLAIDEAGQKSELQELTYIVDTVAPTISQSSIANEAVFKDASTVLEVDFVEDGVGIDYVKTKFYLNNEVTSGLWVGNKFILNTVFRQGRNDWSFLVVDKVGNFQETSSQYFEVDNVGPDLESSHAGGYYSQTQTVTLTSINESSTIHYKIISDQGTIQNQGPSPVEFDITETSKLVFYGVDDLNNESVEVTFDFIVDSTAPEIIAASPIHESTTIDSNEILNLSFRDLESEIDLERSYLLVDNRVYQTWVPNGVQVKENWSEGEHSYSLHLFNKAGLKSELLDQIFMVDTTPPSGILSHPPGKYSDEFVLTIETDDTANLYYTLDGSSPKSNLSKVMSLSSATSFNINIDHSLSLRYYLEDQFGNKGSAIDLDYDISSVAPEVLLIYPSEGELISTETLEVIIKLSVPTAEFNLLESGIMVDGVPKTPTWGAQELRYTGSWYEGLHTIMVILIDDNAEAFELGPFTFKYDNTAPTTTINLPQKVNLSNDDVVTLTTNETATIYYTTDGSEPNTSSSKSIDTVSFRIGDFTELRFFAIDLAGNEEIKRIYNNEFDVNPPVLSEIVPGDNEVVIDNQALISAKVVDQEARIDFSNSEIIVDSVVHKPMWGTDRVYFRQSWLEGAHQFQFNIRDLDGNLGTHAMRTFTIDSTPPETLLSITDIYHQDTIDVSFSTELGGKIYISTSTQSFDDPALIDHQLMEELNLNISDNIYISYYSEDEAGNKENIQEQAFVIDRDSPYAEDVYPADQSYFPKDMKNLTITGTVFDDNSGIDWDNVEVLVDGAPRYSLWDGNRYSMTRRWEENNHTVELNVLDKAGRILENNVYEFSFDSVPPESEITPLGKYVNASQGIKIMANEPSTIFYTLDGTEPNKNSESTLQASLPLEIHPTDDIEIQYLVEDLAGNQEELKSKSYQVDLNPPQIISQAPVNGEIFNIEDDGFEVVVQYSDLGLGIKPNSARLFLNGYEVTDDALHTDGQLRYVAEKVNGRFDFKFQVRDIAENTTVSHFKVYQDLIAPFVFATKPGGSYKELSSISLDLLSEPSATIYYTLNGTTPISGSSGTFSAVEQVTGLSFNASRLLKFYAEDVNGNKSQVYTEYYKLDDDYPVEDLLTLSLTGDHIRLNWLNPTNSKVVIYRTHNKVELNHLHELIKLKLDLPDDYKLKELSNGTSYTDTDIVPQINYYYTVRLVDSNQITNKVSEIKSILQPNGPRATDLNTVVKRAKVWLEAQQELSGQWGDEHRSILETTTVLNAFNESNLKTKTSLAWLKQAASTNNDELARIIQTLDLYSENSKQHLSDLMSSRSKTNQLWPLENGFASDAWASLQAIKSIGADTYYVQKLYDRFIDESIQLTNSKYSLAWISQANKLFKDHLLIGKNTWIEDANSMNFSVLSELELSMLLENDYFETQAYNNSIKNILISHQNLNGSWANIYETANCLRALLDE